MFDGKGDRERLEYASQESYRIAAVPESSVVVKPCEVGHVVGVHTGSQGVDVSSWLCDLETTCWPLR